MSKKSKAIAKRKKKYSKLDPNRKLLDIKGFTLNHLPASFVFLILSLFVVKTAYKLKRESIKFFLLANRAYGAIQLRKCDRMLRIAFRLLGSEFPRVYAELIRAAQKSTLKDPSKRREFSESILLATKHLEQSIFDATGWYQLSRGLFSLGFFRAAWVARENSLDLSIAEGTEIGCSATVISRAIEARLERRNFAEVELLMAYSIGLISENLCKEFNDYFDIMQNKCAVIPNSSNSQDSEAENLFRELITNKSVALVGPGSPSGNYGDEIDSADTVVRLRFGGLESLPDQKFHGVRCDVAQYNDTTVLVDLAYTTDFLNFLNDIKLIIHHGDGPEKINEVWLYKVSTHLPTYRSTATMGMVLLFATILRLPTEVKIYGLDFYSKIEQYSSNLLNFYKKSAWILGSEYTKVYKNGFLSTPQISSSFGAHDPVSNFCFAQNLYKAGLFDIEPFGKSILELTPYQYVERLEEMLGDW